MPLNLNVNQSTGLKFQQPNFNPNEYKMQQNAQLMNALQQAPSLMLQYQQLKQQRELADLSHNVTRQELENKLKILRAQYGTGEPAPATGAPIEGPRLPDATGQEGPAMTVPNETEEQKLARLGIEGYNALNRNQQQYGGYITDINGNTKFVSLPSGFRPANMPQTPIPNLIQPTDETGAPIGSPTVIQPGRLTVTTPKPPQKEGSGATNKKLNVPGFELTGEVTPTELEARQARDSVSQMISFESGISKLRDLVSTYGSTNVMGKGSAEAGTIASDLQLTLKDLAKLGVLSVSDEKFLSQQISNPDSLKSLRLSKEGALNQLDKTLERTREKFEAGMVSKGYAKVGQQQAATPGIPQAGAIEDGHRFKGGNPADPKNWEVVR